jgi:hypothetical protein
MLIKETYQSRVKLPVYEIDIGHFLKQRSRKCSGIQVNDVPISGKQREHFGNIRMGQFVLKRNKNKVNNAV